MASAARLPARRLSLSRRLCHIRGAYLNARRVEQVRARRHEAPAHARRRGVPCSVGIQRGNCAPDHAGTDPGTAGGGGQGLATGTWLSLNTHRSKQLASTGAQAATGLARCAVIRPISGPGRQAVCCRLGVLPSPCAPHLANPMAHLLLSRDQIEQAQRFARRARQSAALVVATAEEVLADVGKAAAFPPYHRAQPGSE